jgi:hypothetical protein
MNEPNCELLNKSPWEHCFVAGTWLRNVTPAVNRNLMNINNIRFILCYGLPVIRKNILWISTIASGKKTL